MAKAKNIDEYIAASPKQVQGKLKEIRQLIRKAAPNAEEVISYQMPAFELHGIILWFAGSKDHCSIYTRPMFLENFKEEIKPYRTSKSTLKFPLDKKLPATLIKNLVKAVIKNNKAKN